MSFDRLIQCHIWLKRWGSCCCGFVLDGSRVHYWFYMLDGLSVYSALLILTFIANMFPLIGSFVKERRGPVLLWQWLITIISCLSIFDKPTVTQQNGCLYAFVHSGSTSLFSQVSQLICPIFTHKSLLHLLFQQ